MEKSDLSWVPAIESRRVSVTSYAFLRAAFLMHELMRPVVNYVHLCPSTQ